jgi:cysteine synthase A
MSVERRKLLAAYGAEIVLTPGKMGMQGAVEEANKIAANIPGAFIAGQFENPANPAAHFDTTGVELWEDTDGTIDAFVACVGTGGTLCGSAKYLKSKNENIKIIAVEPAESPLISEGRAGAHGIQGIGANFVPNNYSDEVVDEVVTVSTEEAYEYTRLLCRKEGLLCGISSGAALCASAQRSSVSRSRARPARFARPSRSTGDTADRRKARAASMA